MQTNKSILLAEDDKTDVLLLRMAFEKTELAQHIQRVRDGSKAIRYLKGEGIFPDRACHPFPCLLLLDLKMPYKNGFDVLAWIRSQPVIKHLVVVVLTASKEDADIRPAYVCSPIPIW